MLYLNHCLIKYKLDIHVFVYFIYFLLWFLCECDFRISCISGTKEKLSELNTFQVRKRRYLCIEGHLKLQIYTDSPFNIHILD